MNRIRNNQLIQLIYTQIMATVREPGVLFWGIVFPILMSLGLGIAFTQKADMIRNVAVVGKSEVRSQRSEIGKFLQDHARISKSRNVEEIYTVTVKNEKLGNTIFNFRVLEWDKAIVELKRGTLNVIMDERNDTIRYHFDPLNPDAQLVYLKLTDLMKDHEELLPEDPADIEPLTLDGTRYVDFLIPGLIALGVISSCMWGISYGIIEKRAKKLLRRMVATPMKKSYFLISLMTVRIGMNFVESALLVLFTYFAFGIKIQGDPSALIAIFIAGNVAFTGIAIFISSHTSNTEIGNGLINAVTMPMMVLSGIFFSYHNFPDWSIGFIRALPLTMLADGIRAVFNEGAGWMEVGIPTAVLTGIGILFFATGLRIFKWH